MDAAMVAVIVGAVLAVGAWFGYAAIGTAVDRKQARATRAKDHSARVELELGHVGARRFFSRRLVVVRRDDEGLAHIRFDRGVRRVGGECLANDEAYDLDLHRGWPLVRARWPLGRARVTMRRRSDGVVVGKAVQPRSWWRRVALRGGAEFTYDGVSYELRPMHCRQRGAQLRADDEFVGSFSAEPGSTRCTATVPASLDDETQLFLVAAAVAFGLTLPDDAAGPGGALPMEAEAGPRSVPMGVALGAGGGAGGGGGGC